MKKLLSILLTLVMAASLINLNNSHTKAEDNADATFTYNGTAWSDVPSGGALIGANTTIEIKNTGSTLNVNVHLVDGTTDTITPGSSKTYTVKYGVLTDDLSAQSDGNINFYDAVNCDGLIYGPKAMGDAPDWYNGTDPNPLNTTSGTKNSFGIEKVSDGVYKFTKELVIKTNSSDNNTLTFNAPIIIKLEKNVSLVQTNNLSCIGMYPTVTNPKIIGNGHTLTLTSKNNNALYWNNKLTLENITIVAKNNSLNYPTFSGGGDFVLEGDCSIDLTNVNDSVGAFLLSGPSFKVVSNQTPMGNKAGGTPEEVELRNATGNNYAYALKSSQVASSIFATHVLLTNVAPKPDPTPSQPKDESCEKVIGPTWHWNNDKGICEDYGVVGTSTR